MTTIFSPNEKFDRIFLLKAIDERRTKTGKPYLAVVLGTPDGAWEARVWDMAMASLPGLLEGDPVHAKGTAQLYQDKIQLIVETISRTDGKVDPRSIYPASDAPEDQLRAEFHGFVSDIENPALIKLMQAMDQDSLISDAFFVSPAAISMHHARIGGLAEHSINVCRLALGATTAAPWLDRDLLTVGALLHDIGKIQEYEVSGDFRYTLEGKFLGHIVQGHGIVEGWITRIPDFPPRLALDLLHIILSHHGQLEYGSPKAPATAEAMVVHFADDLDAKLDMIKMAGEDPGTGEAFVRGLRRSFQYRNDLQGAGRGAQCVDEPEEEKRGTGEEGEQGAEEPETGKPFDKAQGRRGNGETVKQDAGTRRRGDTESDKGKEGQEELF